MRLLRDRRGATAIEYGLIAAFIAIATIGGVRWVGVTLRNVFWNVGEVFQTHSG